MFLNANVMIGEFHREKSKKSTIAPNYHANSLKYKHICHSISQRNHLDFGIRTKFLQIFVSHVFYRVSNLMNYAFLVVGLRIASLDCL